MGLAVLSRSSDKRLALVDRLTKRLSLLTDTNDIVLNFVAMNPGGQSGTISDSVDRETVTDGKMSKSNG